MVSCYYYYFSIITLAIQREKEYLNSRPWNYFRKARKMELKEAFSVIECEIILQLKQFFVFRNMKLKKNISENHSLASFMRAISLEFNFFSCACIFSFFSSRTETQTIQYANESEPSKSHLERVSRRKTLQLLSFSSSEGEKWRILFFNSTFFQVHDSDNDGKVKRRSLLSSF